MGVSQKSVWVLGASGYSGAEICRIVNNHPELHLAGAFSASANNAVPISTLYPQLSGTLDIDLQTWCEGHLSQADTVDIVFLALPHEISHQLAPQFLQAGCCVIDLSGAFRLMDVNKYSEFYGFNHTAPELLNERVYALPHACLTHNEALSAANLLSMPGCYPTAATLALVPLLAKGVLDPLQIPVITAVSGVSGAGRKAQLNTSFCEVSLRPYGVLNHRHQCEIEQNIGCEVIFVPQLGNFKRGIVATVALKVLPEVTQAHISKLFNHAYANDASIRLREQPPQIDDVATTPFCDLYWKLEGQRLVVIAAIDNLLKGAASQAIEACNLKYGWARMEGLL